MQLKFSLIKSTWLCSFLGLGFTLGLAFSERVRCLVLLILPQFFSKRGRSALIGYAFMLALFGPAANTTKNIQVLTGSMTCGQEQFKAAVQNIIDIMQKPFIAIKDAVKYVIVIITKVLKKVKKVLHHIKNLIFGICK